MDERSNHGLLVLTADKEEDNRNVVVWVFPQDTVLRLHSESDRNTINVLEDVFSQKSNLRKAAQFEGKKIKSHFVTGRVLDHQSDGLARDAADFWLDRFLEADLSLKGEAGTRQFAKAAKATYEALAEDPIGRLQFSTAITALALGPQRNLSFQSFADSSLNEDVAKIFLENAPNDDSRRATFAFDGEFFSGLVKYRVFILEGGVQVSSSMGAIGTVVKQSGKAGQHLEVSGTILREKLSLTNRRGGKEKPAKKRARRGKH